MLESLQPPASNLINIEVAVKINDTIILLNAEDCFLRGGTNGNEKELIITTYKENQDYQYLQEKIS